MQNFQKFDQYFVDPQRPEQGLTATSASFLAGLASQECKRLKKIVEGATFYDIHLQIMLDDKSRLMHKGKDATYLEGLPEVVRRIGELTAFIAYTHEAIKEKERRTEYVDGLMFEDWLELPENKEKKTFSEEKIEKPVAPQKADAVDTDWAKARLSVKELTEYLMNEAHAATIGEFVHPKGALAIAKDALAEKIVNPIQANEDGTETTIKAFVPSVDPDLFYRSYNRF
ncbi:MAG TPA: hypothetical protein DCW60_02020, partial [Sutterella sp.]|nr:hypothetical protein [Sutterella sp.]